MLKIIRKVKGVKKPHAEKYIPRKYRARVRWRRKALTVKPTIYLPKPVAVYGTVDGETRRVEMSGTDRSLYNAMACLIKHPPKKRFLRVLADKIVALPRGYLDYEEEWDERPEVIS